MSDWERRVDPNTQREFWINHATRETSWNPPPNGTPLPAGWEEKRDAQGRVFFIDHTTKRTTWVDPRGSSSSSSSTATSSSTPAQQQMSDEELARMLQEQEEVEVATASSSPPQTKSKSMLPSFFGKPKPAAATTTSPVAVASAAAEDDDEALARQLQEEWLVEDESPSTQTRARSGSKTNDKQDIPPSTFSSHLRMRHTIQQAGWRRVFARLHGKTFAIYPNEQATKPEVEVEISGAVLGELESKGGLISKKDIFRFGLMSQEEASKQKDNAKPVSRWAAESENDRALWIAHLILAGAERPEPGLLCRCFLPLLQGPQSETRASGLRVLADVTKQAMAAGEEGPISAAMHESGVLADVIRCLGDSGGGQEHAARLIFYIGGNADCQAVLHTAGAVSQLLDLLTTPDDQLQTWCVAALRPLVAGNASATASCLESDGIFVLTSLLSSPSPDIQGHALAAICTLLTTCTRDDTAGLDPAIAVQMVGTITNALGGAGAYNAVLAAMKGGDTRVMGVATQLVDTLVSLQEQHVIVALRRGGAAGVIVGMFMNIQPTDKDIYRAALSILARLTAGDPFDAAPTFREVARDGGVEALLRVACLRAEEVEMREHACVVIEHLSSHPDFTDILMRSGALQKLNNVISDPNMNATTSTASEILSSAGREVPGQPASARAVGAYCNILCNTTRESDILIAIQSNGMDLVLALMASPHSSISTRAVQLLHAFASCKDDTVQSLVHAMAGRGSGMVSALIGRVMNHLSKHQNSSSPSPAESNAFTITLLALGSLCGSGRAPGAFPGHAETCSEVCSHLDVIRRLVGVVQGLEPAVQTNGGDASAVSAATRLFEALCQNGSAECSSQLANAGALGVVVGRMQQKKTGSSASSERLAALRTFENMVAAAPTNSPELPRGVAAVAGLFSEDGGTPELAVRAVQVLKGASHHSQCHAAIVERGAGPLVDLLMGHHAHIADPSINSRRLVFDVLEILRNVSVNSKHAHAIVDAGGIFAIANLTETGGPPVLPGERDDVDVAALATEILGSLARHPECRLPILECGTASSSMLHLIAKTVQPSGQGLPELPQTVIAAIGTLEILMSNVKHPSVSVAVSRNADVGPALASLLTHGDKRLREKAARLLYFAAAVSDDGGAFWQALQHSGHTTAIVAILATASLGIKSGHGPNAPPGKLAEQTHVASGACGSLTALCHRSHSKAVEVVNAGGLNYLVQLSSIQNMRAAAVCLGTIIFQTDVHRSTLSDGDGGACDVLLQACVKMLINNSSSSQEKSEVVGETSDAVAILDVAVGIMASLCGDSDELANRVSERLSACNSRASAVEHLSAMVQDLKSSPVGVNDANGTPPPLSRTTSNALIVLSSLLMLNGSSASSSKEFKLQPEEIQLISHISPHLVDLLHNLPRQNDSNLSGNSLNVSTPLMRQRLRSCVEGLASVPQCAEAMFRHSRTIPALVHLLKPSNAQVEDSDIEEMLTALLTLHHLNVALPAAVPYAIMEVDDALTSLIALLSGGGAAVASSSQDQHVPTADLLDDTFGSSPVEQPKKDNIDISSTVSEERARVRKGTLRLMLDIATAPPGGSQVSLRHRLAKHHGLLSAVAYPLREAAEAAAPVISDHVDMLYMQPSANDSESSHGNGGGLTVSSPFTTASPSDMFAADLATMSPPDYDVFSTGSSPSYDSLPSSSEPSSSQVPPSKATAPKVRKSDAVLESQALAVRLLGELAAADEAVRAKVLSMSLVFDGAVALLGETEGEGSDAQDSLRSAAARLVRNLTLSLVIGGTDDGYSGQSYADLTTSQISGLHHTLVTIATREVSQDSQIDAAADCAWGLRTLMAKDEALKLTMTSSCISRILVCLARCVEGEGVMDLASPLVSIIQSLAQHPDAVSVMVYSGLLRTIGQVLQFSAKYIEQAGVLLAVESTLVLSAVAFHPEARIHADMEFALSQLRSMVSTGSNSTTAAFTAGHVLGPMADRALAACGRTSMNGVRSAKNGGIGAGLTPLSQPKPLKVPGWNSGPANKLPTSPSTILVNPTMVSPQSVESSKGTSHTTAHSPVVATPPLTVSQPLIPSADSIAEAAAAAQSFSSPRSPTSSQNSYSSQSSMPQSNPNLKWSESEDEALARRLQAEDEGHSGGGGSFQSSSYTTPNMSFSNMSSNNMNDTMAADAALALRLQQEDAGGSGGSYYSTISSSQRDEPPMPLTSLGKNYTPPPPSYGSF